MLTSIEILHDMIGQICDLDEILAGWKEGYHVRTPKKKGDIQECKNYRGMMPGKVLIRIILEIPKNEVDNILRYHHADIRQYR